MAVTFDEKEKSQGEISTDEDIIKYVITERLQPNKVSLKTKKENFLKYSNLYKGVQTKKNYSGLANLYVPEILKSTETLTSLIHFGIFGSPIFMRFRGVEDSDEVSAKNMTDLMYYEMSENLFKIQTMDFIRNMLIYGTSVRKIFWDFVEKEVTKPNLETGKPEKSLETSRDSWTFEDVDIFNFWLPPETPWYDIQKAEWIAETQNVSESWLRNKIKKGWIEKEKGEKLISESWLGKSNQDTPDYFTQQRLNKSEIYVSESKNKYLITNWYGWIPAKYIDKELDSDEPVLALIILGNDKVILKKAKISDVFWHNRYPYVSCCFVPLNGEFFGLGIAQICESLQEELNDTRNQVIDNKTLILMNMWLIDKNAQINPKDLIARPNGVIRTLNMDGLRPLAPPLFSGLGISIEGTIKEDMRQAVAAISGLQGIPQQGVGSATEFQGLQNSSMTRNKMVIESVAECVLKPLFQIAKYLNYQFYDHRKLIKIIGAKGIKTRLLGPDEIIGNYDIELEMSTDFEKNPNVLRQQLTTAVQMLLNIPPQVIQFHWKLISKMLMELGIDNPEDFYPSLVPESEEILLTPDEEHQVILEGQAVKTRNGDNDIEHLQGHVPFREKIYLSAPPYVLSLIDEHIKSHMVKIEKARQEQMMQMQQMMQSQAQGQKPNSSPNTMQNSNTDNALLKGIENV